MLTVDDLRTTLDQLADTAPPATGTTSRVRQRLARLEHPPRPRRTRRPSLTVVTASLALAVVVALGVKVTTVLTQPVGAPAAPALVWTFDLPDPPPGSDFHRYSITSSEQTGRLERADHSASLLLTVHGAGSFDPLTDLRSPRPVEVDGRAGYTGPEGDAPQRVPGLADTRRGLG